MRSRWPVVQVLCVNDELKMGKGKIAAQCGHGVAGIFNKYRRKQPVAFQQWEMLGGAKIALKVSSTKELVRPCCLAPCYGP